MTFRPAGTAFTYVFLDASGEPGHPDSLAGVDHVDVLLRPDARAAEGTADLQTFWDGAVTFENVPLLRKTPR